MKDYFSHDYNSRNDKKLVKLSMKFDLCTSIGAYWCIVEMLYEEGGYLLLSEYERITYELRTSENIIKYLIYDSELFENDGEKFWSNTAIDRLKMRAEKSQKAKDSIEKRWNKHKNTNVLQTINDRNTSKVKESKVKEIKEKQIESISSLFLNFFENEIFSNTWKEFHEMRKKKNKPLTIKAEKLTLKELEKLSLGNVDDAVKILNRSIQFSWTGVFPLKTDFNNGSTKKPNTGTFTGTDTYKF